MKLLTRLSILFLYWLYAMPAYSQADFTLQINTNIPDFSFEKKKIDIQKTHSGSLSIETHLQAIVLQLHNQSFLEAALDTLIFQEKKAIAQLHVGPSYEWLTLENTNVPPEVLKAIDQKLDFFGTQKINWTHIEQLQEQLLDYAADKGYPFAEVWLNNLVIDQHQVRASLHWELHDKITIGDIHIIGEANIKPTYLAAFLGLPKGTTYNKTQLLNSSKRLKNLPYITEKQAVKVIFRDKEASLYFFLENKNASRFDLLVGILPDNRPSLQGQRLIVTGNGVIDLFSAFGRGERLILEFQQIRPQAQELSTYFNIPYLLNSPFGVTVDFDLFKNDSTNLLVQTEFGIQYFLDGEHYIQAFFKNQNTRLLSINENLLLQQKQLPQNIDTRQNLFGITHYISRLDNRFNPRRGWASHLRASAGQKTVVPNNLILGLTDPADTAFDFGTLYAPFASPTIQYQLEGDFRYFIPINRRSTIYLQSRNGLVLNEATIFENELFRIGGNQIQRGFDEASILASLFSVNTVEYRWLFANNSNIYAFSDIGYIEKKSSSTFQVQQLIGIGVGLQLETSVGIFGMSVALGKDQRNTADFFDLRNPKIHFGYVSVF